MSASGRGVELQPPVTRRRASLFTRQNKYEVDYSELEAVGRKKSFANLRAAWLHGPHLLNATRYVDVSLPIEHDACSTMAYEVDDVCRSIYTPHAETECCRGPCLHDDCSTALQEPRYRLPTAMFLMARRGEFTMVNIRVAQPAANTRVANGTACMESGVLALGLTASRWASPSQSHAARRAGRTAGLVPHSAAFTSTASRAPRYTADGSKYEVQYVLPVT